ncbi:MAG: SGNH/GDSL hydrolase family protein [Bacteroidota bacterium]|jgi:lysophospholipase L1-like esterase
MKLMMKFFLIAAGLATLSLIGCSDSAPNGPVASLGSVTVKKYVAVGNSITAGYQSAGLYQSAQVYSYPNLISQQLTKAGASLGSFEQPYYSDPGTPDATGKASRYEIISLVGPVIGPKGLAAGAPTNIALTRPYDNLGIPGIPLAGFMDETGTYQSPPLGRDAILRWTSAFPTMKSVYKQAVSLNPDLMTFWLGANDVLGYATTGGTSPAAPTPTTTFTALYTQALASIRASLPNVKLVVANIPDVKAIPFFNTVGPAVAAKIGALGLKLYYQKAGESGVASGSTTLTEANPPLLTLVGMAYAPYLGQPTGLFYRANGIPYATVHALGIDTTQPFGLHPQNPWPNALVLDATEQTNCTNAINAFNATIASVAAANGAAVVDFFAFFNNVAANGYSLAGETYTTAYIEGGLFSLDGVHPSSRGYGIVANEYIKVMNAKFGMSIPLVDISQIPGIPAPLGKISSQNGLPVLPLDALKDFQRMFGATDLR